MNRRALLMAVWGKAWVSRGEHEAACPQNSYIAKLGWMSCWVSVGSPIPTESLATPGLPPYGQSLREM